MVVPNGAAPGLVLPITKGKRIVEQMDQDPHAVSRRSLLKAIGTTAGSAVMYDMMVAMGYAGTSDFNGPIKLSGDVKGASVLVLGAGLSGMTAAYELRKAGYKVQMLEYNDRPGGRNWSLYGGDSYTEMGGVTQHIEFDKGLYFNPGPWRIPYHHRGLLYYCKLLNVPLDSFVMVNYNAYVHSTKAFNGKPQRYRQIAADFDGYIGELLAKATSQDKLDGAVTKDEKDGLLQVLRFWGALDKNYEYKKSEAVSNMRGYDVEPGGGLSPLPVDSDPLPMKELFDSGMWFSAIAGKIYEFQTPLVPGHRRHGHDRQGVRPLAGRYDQIQLQSDRHQTGRQRRHCHLCRFQERRRGADRACRLVRLHHSRLDPGADSDAGGRADAQRHQFAFL